MKPTKAFEYLAVIWKAYVYRTYYNIIIFVSEKLK